jgi:hypothetical protein
MPKGDPVAVTGEVLVHRVVHHLVNQPLPSSVSPMYMPGRLRTPSSPFNAPGDEVSLKKADWAEIKSGKVTYRINTRTTAPGEGCGSNTVTSFERQRADLQGECAGSGCRN